MIWNRRKPGRRCEQPATAHPHAPPELLALRGLGEGIAEKRNPLDSWAGPLEEQDQGDGQERQSAWVGLNSGWGPEKRFRLTPGWGFKQGGCVGARPERRRMAFGSSSASAPASLASRAADPEALGPAVSAQGASALFDMIEYYESATHLNISFNKHIGTWAGRPPPT